LITFDAQSPGILLVIHHRTPSHLPLTIYSIETGEELHTNKHMILRNKRVSFVEQFNDKLLIKQENDNLRILDVRIFHVQNENFSVDNKLCHYLDTK